MRVLVFDTETTGLPVSPSAQKIKNLFENQTAYWPYIIQISYVVVDIDDTKSVSLLKKVDHILKIPEDATLSPESFNLHGISKEQSLSEGLDCKDVLKEFMNQLSSVDRVIGHNIRFDLDMVKVSLMRLSNESTFYKNYLSELKNLQSKNVFYCTQSKMTSYCNITARRPDGTEYIKWPKLAELYVIMFKEPPPLHLHNSLIDTIVCLRCYAFHEHAIDVYTNEQIRDIIS
tara:strand:- start:228 stop:920 length:693 start_codon:yes stop_codon:yes gene_type:complete